MSVRATFVRHGMLTVVVAGNTGAEMYCVPHAGLGPHTDKADISLNGGIATVHHQRVKLHCCPASGLSTYLAACVNAVEHGVGACVPKAYAAVCCATAACQQPMLVRRPGNGLDCCCVLCEARHRLGIGWLRAQHNSTSSVSSSTS